MPKLTYSVSEAARAIGISRSKLYELIGENRLRTICIGRRRLVPIDEVQSFIGRPSPN